MNAKKLIKNVQAVSPIIATLMLVLVAVGASGSFYLWQTGWQEDVEGKAGGVGLTSALSVGGSSTVYEFTVLAKEIFENQHPNYRIDLQKGGSGSGITGVGMGLIDIGAASKPIDSYMDEYPDLNRDGIKDLGIDLVTYKIADDGVAIVVSPNNPFIGTGYITSMNQTTLVKIYNKDPAYDTWGEIPIAWNVTTNLSSSGATLPTGYTSWDVQIATYDRADESGTEECFCDKICSKLITGSAKQMAAGVADHSIASNQLLYDGIYNDNEGIGFIPYGMLGDLEMIEFHHPDTNKPDLFPSTAGIKSYTWCGSRPLNLITIGEATGDAKVFVDFCLRTEMNQQLAEMSGYVSIFA